jgi:ABC-2 type transport system permease protein
MIPAQLGRMVGAEVRKTFTRSSGIAALILAVFLGVVSVLAMWRVSSMGADGPSLNGTPVSQMVELTGVKAAGWALTARNFFVLPLLLLLATAGSVAGELGDRTLREVVVRPVPRWSILAAKLVALAGLSAATLALTAFPALGLGLAIFGGTPVDAPVGTADVLDVIGGYGASFLSDVGLLAIATFVSLMVRSVGGVVVTLTLALMADLALRGVLTLAANFGVTQAETLRPWTLGNALGCWEGWDGGYDPARFVALAGFTAAAALASVARFHRMDVP